MLIFVSGGVRSGKSYFAEQKAMELASDSKELHYIATSIVYDEEMKKRIRKHQEDRTKSGLQWNTVECSANIGEIASRFSKKDVVLIDCLTTLLANEMFSEQNEDEQSILLALQKIANNSFAVIIVSNEIFSSGTMYERETLNYMRKLGRLHVEIAAVAKEVYLVENGIPRKKKG
ncbi:bifunctional adenosylcobinamide kinase/adenosylcobinamide-phosphate guanylyltransferase [Metabacillus fastidiosus]|uniref:bifunctional adenosylcobinamide kinase/adenosylcobinamide-phosphate guanylyltransferase n=1 Tax=Metabacillus fastidiosus TaxID=1458 RepID=UPI002E244E35|nr:bifunctional adenosylcobinamide kinase/adenosylcobinamide-phosphate guanylyltransferase [Metabacillus fastidiosus]